MKTQQDFKSRLGYLWYKYQNSGICGNSVILDSELQELHDGLVEIARFMRDMNNSDLVEVYFRRAEMINAMICARSAGK